MRTVTLVSAVGVAASVIALAGCAPFVATGPMTSEERDITAVSVVVLDAAGDLSISEGEPSLVIHAPEDVIDRLTSEVEGDTLRLGRTPGFDFRLTPVRYDLTLPDLEAIDLNGSGDIEATVSSDGTVRLDLDGSGDVEWSGIDADRVEIRLAGSGDVEVQGSADELSAELDGSGGIDAEDLTVQDAVVSVGGSGAVDVSASASLTAEISGSGRVTYSGDPSVQSEVSGSGDVVRR